MNIRYAVRVHKIGGRPKRLDPGRNDGTLLIYSGDGVINQYRGHAIANWRNPEKALEAWPDEDEGKPSGDDWPPGGRPYF